MLETITIDPISTSGDQRVTTMGAPYYDVANQITAKARWIPSDTFTIELGRFRNDETGAFVCVGGDSAYHVISTSGVSTKVRAGSSITLNSESYTVTRVVSRKTITGKILRTTLFVSGPA